MGLLCRSGTLTNALFSSLIHDFKISLGITIKINQKRGENIKPMSGTAFPLEKSQNAVPWPQLSVHGKQKYRLVMCPGRKNYGEQLTFSAIAWPLVIKYPFVRFFPTYGTCWLSFLRRKSEVLSKIRQVISSSPTCNIWASSFGRSLLD